MEYKVLKDIAKITMGQSPDSSSYNDKKDGLPFFQGNTDFGELYPNERVWCNEPKKIAKKDDILISVRAPIGALNFAKDKCCIGRGLAAITIEDKTERNYVFYLLKARNNDLNQKGTGSTFKAIGKNVLEEVLVPQIDRDEQQKCTDMMDLLEFVIREKKSQLNKLDDLIKARFVEMFMNKDNKDKYPLKLWKDVIIIKHGKDYKKNIADKEGYPIYGSGGFIGVYADNYLIDENSIIIGRKGTIDKPLFTTEKVWNVDTAFGIVVNKEILNPIFFFIRSTMYNLKSMSTSTTLPSMTKSTLEKIEIGIPPIELQNQFADFVQQVDKSKFDILFYIKNNIKISLHKLQ